MKRYLVTGLLAGFCLAVAWSAFATKSLPPNGAFADYVNPAFLPPKAPQACGEDGGAGCVLTFNTSACLRIATQGTWKYQVNSFDLLPDAGTAINLATCTLLTLADGGPVTYPDGGSYPDGGTYLGGVIPFPRLTPLTDDKVEGFCLYSTQNKLSACTVDGGILSISERYP